LDAHNVACFERGLQIISLDVVVIIKEGLIFDIPFSVLGTDEIILTFTDGSELTFSTRKLIFTGSVTQEFGWILKPRNT